MNNLSFLQKYSSGLKTSVIRNFAPGSDWLFAKIYCGTKTADEIIANLVSETNSVLLSSNIIKSWFFIRYADPRPHLRWRLHLVNSTFTGDVINKIHENFSDYLTDDIVWKIQYDTYQREIERYGENFIETAETIFGIESQFIVGIIKTTIENANEDFRWQIALPLVDAYFDLFGYSLEEKIKLSAKMSSDFEGEFSVEQPLKFQIDKLFRAKNSSPNSLLLAPEIFSERFQKFKTEISVLTSKFVGSNTQKDNLVRSMIHMLFNRLFSAQPRKHELVLYNFINRLYSSQKARNLHNQ